MRLNIVSLFLLFTCQHRISRMEDALKSAHDLFRAAIKSFIYTPVKRDISMFNVCLDVTVMQKEHYHCYTTNQLEAYNEMCLNEPEPLNPDSEIHFDEKSFDEVRFQYRVARKLIAEIYSGDVTAEEIFSHPYTNNRRLLRHSISCDESTDIQMKKAMYYYLCGHVFELLHLCGDNAKEAFERARNCRWD